MDLNSLFWLIAVTVLPIFELRASIPLGLWNKPIALPYIGTVNGFGLSVWEVLPVVIVSNILIGVFLFFFLGFLVRVFTKVPFIKEIYNKLVVRTQRKAKSYVDKYGSIGLALFIGFPLPGTGVWTGALAAYLLGMDFRHFFFAATAGVLIAATIMAAVSLGLLNGLPI